ncbi:LysR substrate-binding domain-containing protein [Parapusillimonas sp. JC17]|uniref:LysR substrate-binding domain-containing protein n=1 Tax=Parapusillimonas sp. JC17 TaxID=3445768 RepID=UPI003FA10F13
MTASNTNILSRIPSLRSLLVFNAAARHLNQVRAAEELCLTQSALSRQLKSLEEHLGVQLFERGPRGLRFTQEGELLYDFTSRAFALMGEGINRLGITTERHTLVVSVARGFAQRVLAPRLGEFVSAHPQIDLHIDIHRYYADLESSGADISIRLGVGDWDDYHSVKITDDALVPVCAPPIAERIKGREDIPDDIIVLRNREREYLDTWMLHPRVRRIPTEGRMSLSFNDSATLISALESGVGIAVSRSSLVSDALESGSLVRPFEGEIKDGLDYYAVSSRRSRRNAVVSLFMQWLEAKFESSFSAATVRKTAPRSPH